MCVMKTVFKALLSVVIGLFITHCAGAQTREGEITFRRSDRMFNWQTTNSGLFDLSDKFGLKLNSRMSTQLNMQTGSGVKDRWYDDIRNNAELIYTATEKIDVSFLADERWNKDTMNTTGKSLLSTNFGGRARYTRSKNNWFEGEIENTYDTRFDNIDKGSTAKGKIRYSGLPLKSIGNFKTKVNIDGDKSNMKRASNRLSFNGDMSYDHDLANVTVKLNDIRTMRGYYSVAGRDDEKNGDSVEQRERLIQNIELNVSRGFMGHRLYEKNVEVIMDVGRERTDDSANDNPNSSKYHNNSKINMMKFSLRAARKIGKKVFVGYQAEYSKDDKDVEKQIRSRIQTNVVTRGDLVLIPGASDSLTFFGRIWRTRIDTPLGVPNDRDELKIEGGAVYNHRFSNNFHTALDFRVLETHYVNIDVSQSSQNKWMKTYLFSPSVVYIPASFLSIRHDVSIYANHINYDFDDSPVVRSNITRRVVSETWVDADVSSRTRVTLGFMIEDNDYGKLNSKGLQLPVEEGTKRFGDISVEYRLTDWLVCIPRYIYYIRKDWETARNRYDLYRREVDQTYGIRCKLFNNRTNNYDFEIGAKRIVRKTITRLPRIRNYINMTLRYGF